MVTVIVTPGVSRMVLKTLFQTLSALALCILEANEVGQLCFQSQNFSAEGQIDLCFHIIHHSECSK